MPKQIELDDKTLHWMNLIEKKQILGGAFLIASSFVDLANTLLSNVSSSDTKEAFISRSLLILLGMWLLLWILVEFLIKPKNFLGNTQTDNLAFKATRPDESGKKLEQGYLCVTGSGLAWGVYDTKQKIVIPQSKWSNANINEIYSTRQRLFFDYVILMMKDGSRPIFRIYHPEKFKAALDSTEICNNIELEQTAAE